MTPPAYYAAMIVGANVRAPTERPYTNGTPGASLEGRISEVRPQLAASGVRYFIAESIGYSGSRSI